THRELGMGMHLVNVARLQVVGSMHGLPGGGEHRQDFVATHLDQLAIPLLNGCAGEIGEARRQLGGSLVTVLPGEVRVAANIGDQED
ncbi:MAG: hypothetical protein ACXWQZ_23570, partial [Ktedonobacterales bacterium]